MPYNYMHHTHNCYLRTHVHCCTVKVLLLIIPFLKTLSKFFFGFFILITMQRSRVPFLANFALFPFLIVSPVVTSRYWREAAIAQFLSNRNLPLSCNPFYLNDFHSSKSCLPSQRGHIMKTSLVE